MRYRIWDPYKKHLVEDVVIYDGIIWVYNYGKTELVPLYTDAQLLAHDMSWKDFIIMEGLDLENKKTVYAHDIVLNRDRELGVIIQHKGLFYFRYVFPYDQDPMNPGYIVNTQHDLKVIGNVAHLKEFTDLDIYMAIPYHTEFTKYKDGSVFAKIIELEGCMTEANNMQEALTAIEDAKQEWLKAALEDKIIIPLPKSIY